MASTRVQLEIKDDHVIMDNGILQVTLSKPGGIVTKIEYNGIQNLLEERSPLNDRGYWDLVWSQAGSTGTTGTFDRMIGTEFKVIVQEDERVELSFTRPWDPSLVGKFVPLNIDKRFIMLRNSSGFYSYGIYEKLKGWPAFNFPQTRIVFMLTKDRFHYMAVADNRQREMPLPDDRSPERCQVLAYPEAVLLTNPVEEQFKEEVDDKYQYSSENKDLKVHGWICTDQPTGFWQITPSNEFRSGGLSKQNLTSHVGPFNLAMFYSAHYAGEDMVLKFEQDEYWKRVFGPVFMYLNSAPEEADWHWLWEDAKQQWVDEVERWPYWFPASEDFPSADQRGNISGRLLVFDRYVSEKNIPAKKAYVGLAPPGEPGSWQLESKGYQFWTISDGAGFFSIQNIRQGDYKLFAWVPGFLGEYCSENLISIKPGGGNTELGDIVFQPPRTGPTLWEIGFPDRTARGFYIPDPDPKYINRLYVGHPDRSLYSFEFSITRLHLHDGWFEVDDRIFKILMYHYRFRQYGLWDRYTELYPDKDLVFTVGTSDYRKDWFFAHVPRKKNNTYHETTWQIKFQMNKAEAESSYKLQLALAAANKAELQVRVNDPSTGSSPLFTTGLIGNDNAISRHGIHGIYRFYSLAVKGSMLVQGENTIFLRQARSDTGGPFMAGVLYDYIRLEGPPANKSLA